MKVKNKSWTDYIRDTSNSFFAKNIKVNLKNKHCRHTICHVILSNMINDNAVLYITNRIVNVRVYIYIICAMEYKLENIYLRTKCNSENLHLKAISFVRLSTFPENDYNAIASKALIYFWVTVRCATTRPNVSKERKF